MSVRITVISALGDVEVAEDSDYEFRDDDKNKRQIAMHLMRANAKIARAYGLEGPAWDQFKEMP